MQHKKHNIISVFLLLKVCDRSLITRTLKAKNHRTYFKACFQNGMNVEDGK